MGSANQLALLWPCFFCLVGLQPRNYITNWRLTNSRLPQVDQPTQLNPRIFSPLTLLDVWNTHTQNRPRLVTSSNLGACGDDPNSLQAIKVPHFWSRVEISIPVSRRPRDWSFPIHDWSTYPPLMYPQKIRTYERRLFEPLVSLSKALLYPYFCWGTLGGVGWLVMILCLFFRWFFLRIRSYGIFKSPFKNPPSLGEDFWRVFSCCIKYANARFVCWVFGGWLFCVGKKATVTTKNGWLEDYSFLLGWLPGRCERLVSGEGSWNLEMRVGWIMRQIQV